MWKLFLPVVKRHDAIPGRSRTLVRVQPGRFPVSVLSGQHAGGKRGALAERQLHPTVDRAPGRATEVRVLYAPCWKSGRVV